MLARRLLRLASLMLVVGLAAGCGGGSMGDADAMAAAPDVQVLQPPPGVDIDRSTASGQVVDSQGLLGWYPHEDARKPVARRLAHVAPHP